MATEAGMEIYRKRAPVVEGVFGVIKHAMGVRRFLLRGRSALSPAWAFGAFSCAASKKCEPNGRGYAPPSI